jgi:hypothetical protein
VEEESESYMPESTFVRGVSNELYMTWGVDTYACFPAPNTVTVFTFDLRVIRREEARAVRKAVTSSALRNPIGLPSFAMIVRAP